MARTIRKPYWVGRAVQDGPAPPGARIEPVNAKPVSRWNFEHTEDLTEPGRATELPLAAIY